MLLFIVNKDSGNQTYLHNAAFTVGCMKQGVTVYTGLYKHSQVGEAVRTSKLVF